MPDVRPLTKEDRSLLDHLIAAGAAPPGLAEALVALDARAAELAAKTEAFDTVEHNIQWLNREYGDLEIQFKEKSDECARLTRELADRQNEALERGKVHTATLLALAEARAALRGVDEAFVVAEKSYGRSIWTTGAGYILQLAVEKARAALGQAEEGGE